MFKSMVVGLLTAVSLSATATPSWIDAKSAIQAMQQGELTSEQLVRYYLDRIEQHNQQGHNLAAVMDINPQAIQQAQLRDQERASHNSHSALHGLPVILKANISTATMPTTAGALALKNHITGRNAALVDQLEQAGAIILGTANLSEWANFRGTGSASGWSALGGQARNPHLLTHTPCGSSSGSAVAVAADLALLAVGTETDGSIMCPAAINGVVGIKPTRGAVAGEGIIPIASAQDIAGPMARHVFDAALLLDAMLSDEARKQLPVALTKATEQAPELSKVILVRAYDEQDEAIGPMMDGIAEFLLQQGIAVVSVDEWQLPAELYQDELKVLMYEYRRELDQWLQDYGVDDSVNSVAKVVAFNQAKGEEALAFFGQEYLEQAANLDLELENEDYQRALANGRQLAMNALDQYLKELEADAIILPSYGPAWPIDHINGDVFNFGTSTAAAVAGYPSITLPGGFSGVLPLGVSLVGLPWSEPTLIGLAALMEKELKAYQQPTFLSQDKE
ncbi:amidase family protein [Alkalimonas collagenimarina]|uniref:Amidase family protein n=1 Tax=Alkalimonas collagenimarina TaxID=400390 RepID=A0ABT9GXH0_9GAMM|nr:amidase family protein [Alkalimonas collagenimarina]MDP4535757.1 amidase family protein [Alkalimonas collagenimarina]